MPAPLHAYHEDFGYYEERSAGLLASARDGTETVTRAFAEHDAPLTADGARAVVATEHGLDSWDELRVRALLELGADPTVKDGIYDSTPAGWAEHSGQRRALQLLRAAGA